MNESVNFPSTHVENQRFGETCCLHLQVEVTSKYSEMLVSYHTTTQRHSSEYHDLNFHRRENLRPCFYVIWMASSNTLVFPVFIYAVWSYVSYAWM